MRHILFAAGLLAALALGAVASAETVVLVDGTALEGQVSTLKGRVTIVTDDATLTLPADKVLQIGRAPVAEPARPRHRSRRPPSPRSLRRLRPPPRPRRRVPSVGPTPLLQALARRIDVNFDGTPPAEVFDYLQQASNINLVIDPDVRASTSNISLTLRNASMASVLDVLGKWYGYSYEVQPSHILHVRSGKGPGRYVLRVYDVRDLLLSREDTGAGAGTQGAGGSNTGA